MITCDREKTEHWEWQERILAPSQRWKASQEYFLSLDQRDIGEDWAGGRGISDRRRSLSVVIAARHLRLTKEFQVSGVHNII